MAKLDRMIADAREERAEHKRAAMSGQHGRWVDAAAAAIRERALLDARKAIVGRVDPGFEFRVT